MKVKKFHLLPNVITAFGLCCGLFAIFKINMIEPGAVTKEVLEVVTGILLLAALADIFDGAIARAMKVESEFGGFFDCIADAITFGVAPSIIVLKSLSIPPLTEMSFLITAAAMVYTVCGVLRLVRFSVMSHEAAEDELLKAAQKKNFTGLPIPAAAAALISGNLFLVSSELNRWVSVDAETRTWILFTQMIVLGYFMISRWKFPSLKALHVRVTSFRQVFLMVLVTVFVIFYGLMRHFSVAFVAVAWGYVIVAWILSIVRKISGNKSKTLEDFEPEPDELSDVE
ncbi:MAG: CDP-alcohol phosphatidyltransferase family protein [Parachlamydiaceae bacterium]|nr:CDP-alcohol phosphatidyltransferase family protein [Parachlamydiaceae bacterium]